MQVTILNAISSIEAEFKTFLIQFFLKQNCRINFLICRISGKFMYVIHFVNNI